MDKLLAVAQHICNISTKFNQVLESEGYTQLAKYYSGKIRTAVNMAFTCGFSVSVLADPFLDNVVAVRVWDLETDEVLLKGTSHLYSKIYNYDYWNILYEKLPNSTKRK